MKFLLAIVSMSLSAMAFSQSKTGVVYVNGVVASSEFDLEGVAHTEEIKPNGAILALLCGTANRSELLCVSGVQGAPDLFFIEIRTMRGTEYLPAKRVVAQVAQSQFGSNPPIYYIAQRVYETVRGKPVAKEYKIVVLSKE